MSGGAPGRGAAIALGILVTFLWATSVILIRLGLTTEEVKPIGFAGVRFSLAALVLLPVALPQLRRVRAWTSGRRALTGVAVYGLLLFCLAQLAFYIALGQLTASTVGLLMALAPIVTTLLVMRSQHERASLLQVGGIVVLMAGVVLYFGAERPPADAALPLAAGIAIPIIVGASARLGRHLAVDAVPLYGGPLGLTALAMLVGGPALLLLGLAAEGVPSFSPSAWLLILWLAVVNTALTYTLWTQTQRTLRAVEASVLGDLTVILVAALGWLVLDEQLDAGRIVGLAVALAGIALVQLAPGRIRPRAVPEQPPLP